MRQLWGTFMSVRGGRLLHVRGWGATCGASVGRGHDGVGGRLSHVSGGCECGHKSPFSAPGPCLGALTFLNRAARIRFIPHPEPPNPQTLSCRYAVDLVISGHVHGYERTHPVFNYQQVWGKCGRGVGVSDARSRAQLVALMLLFSRPRSRFLLSYIQPSTVRNVQNMNRRPGACRTRTGGWQTSIGKSSRLGMGCDFLCVNFGLSLGLGWLSLG